jgi:hypothetical protein
MSMQDDFRDEQSLKQGMSSTAKVLLILGAIAGVGLLACCGGGVYFGFKAKDVFQEFAKNAISSDPAVIRQRTQEIVHIDIPEGFEPSQSLQFSMMNVAMKQVVYQRKGSGGSMLMIMETNQPMQGANTKQQREQMLRAMRQQQGQQPDQLNDELNEENSETREFTINGEKVPFEFIKGTGTDNARAFRQVVGIFRVKSATVMVMLMVPEGEYDEPAVVRMIESIQSPGAESDGSADDTDMSDDLPAGAGDEPAAEKSEPVPDRQEDEAAAPSESTP